MTRAGWWRILSRPLVLHALVAGAIVAWAWPAVTAGAEDRRQLLAFYTDEYMHQEAILDALTTGRWLLAFGHYGDLAFTAALLPSRLWQVTGPLEPMQIVVMLRVVSLAGAVATGAALLWWLRPAGALPALTGAVTGIFAWPPALEYAVVSHPDLPQLAFLSAGLGFAYRAVSRRQFRDAMGSAVCCGLASATKFGGVFLAPFVAGAALTGVEGQPRLPRLDPVRCVRGALWAAAGLAAAAAILLTPARFAFWLTVDGHLDAAGAAALQHGRRAVGALAVLLAGLAWWGPWRWVARSQTRRSALLRVGLCVVAVLSTFAIASPGSLVQLAFAKGLYREYARLGPATWQESLANAGIWLRELSAVLPAAVIALALAGLWRPLACGMRAGPVAALQTLGGFGAAWVLTVVCVLARVRPGVLHYAIPVLPGLAALVAQGAADGAHVARRLSGQALGGWAVAAAALAVVLVAVGGPSLALRRTMSERATTEVVQVGRWLEQVGPREAPVVADYLTYIPPTFDRVHFTWTDHRTLVPAVRPLFVVLHTGRQQQLRAEGLSPDEVLRGPGGYRVLLRCRGFTVHAARWWNVPEPPALPPAGCQVEP